GRGETMNLINEWLDPRLIDTVAFAEANDDARARPWMWRYWMQLPTKGRIGMFFGSYYSDALFDRVFARSDRDAFDRQIFDILRFERMLTQDGVVVLKFWFHLSRDKQKQRLKTLEQDPASSWRVTKTDWEHYERYDKIRKSAEHILRLTNTAAAPWVVVDGEDANYRSLTV
ncbi:polyphosphate:AMP phosphotransferase, partial [Pseudomonas sp. MWU13-2860]